jgi:hypothetical protein
VTALAVVALLLVTAGLGLGLALRLLDRPVDAVACAPAVGLALLAVVATWLAVGGVPVLVWARPVTVVALAASAVVAWRSRAALAGLTEVRPVVAAHAAAALLLMAPVLAGGEAFTHLRGNAVDALNYVEGADLLGHLSPREARATPPEALFARNPCWPIPAAILWARYTTQLLLAWAAAVAGLRPLDLDFGVSLLWLVCLVGPCWTLLRQAGVGPWPAVAAATALATGFTPQLVVDLRAQSQLSAWPVVALLLVGLTHPGLGRQADGGARRRAAVLVGLALAAIALCYAELFPCVVAGFLVHAVAARREVSGAGLGGSAAAGALLAAPLAPFLTKFLLMQASTVASPIMAAWHLLHFQRPLLDRPLEGVLGLTWCLTRGPLADGALGLARDLLVLGLGLGLLTVAVEAIGRALVAREVPAARRAVAAFTLAAAVQAVVCLALDRPWALGKAITYAHPWLPLALCQAGLAAGVCATRAGRLRAAAVAVFVGLQLVLAAERTHVAATGVEPRGVMVLRRDYRAFDTRFGALEAAVDDRPVAVFTASQLLNELLALSLAGRAPTVVAGPMREASRDLPIRARGGAPRELLVVERRTASAALLAAALATNDDLAVVPAAPGSAPDRVAWVVEAGERAVRLHLFVPLGGRFELVAGRRDPGELPGALLVRPVGGAGAPFVAPVDAEGLRVGLELDAGFSAFDLAPPQGSTAPALLELEVRPAR